MSGWIFFSVDRSYQWYISSTRGSVLGSILSLYTSMTWLAYAIKMEKIFLYANDTRIYKYNKQGRSCSTAGRHHIHRWLGLTWLDYYFGQPVNFTFAVLQFRYNSKWPLLCEEFFYWFQIVMKWLLLIIVQMVKHFPIARATFINLRCLNNAICTSIHSF